MGKLYTGIDIGGSQIKFAVCESGGGIRHTASYPVPQNLVQEGRIVSFEAMSKLIGTAARELKIHNRNSAVLLPASLAFTRRFSLPMMTIEQLKLNLPYEFRDYITEETDKHVYDYAVLGTSKNKSGQQELDLMAAAAKKSTIASYFALLRQAGFRLRTAVPVELAYGNLLRRYEADHPSEGSREYCILDLGCHATRVHIFTGFRFEVTRVIDHGCAALDTAIADTLRVDEHIAESYKISNHDDVQSLESCRNVYHSIAIEIMRAVNFYSFNNQASHLEEAFYCGGGSRIKPLLEDISLTAGLKLRSIADLMPKVAEEQTEQLLLYPAAVGITQQ